MDTAEVRTLEGVRCQIEEQGIDTVEYGFVDLHGTLRGKRITASQFLETEGGCVSLSTALFVWGFQAEIYDDSPFSNWGNGFPDFQLVPDLQTFRVLPWRDRTAFVLCDAVHGGDPLAFSPRQVLGSALGRCAAAGFEPAFGFELEFYLLDAGTRSPSGATLPVYSLHQASEHEPVLQEIRDALARLGIAVEACNAEYGAGQFEMNLRYGPAIEAADAVILFRYAVKQVAAKHGKLATFMAKPFADQAGCGMHLHQSLARTDGTNAFYAPDADGASPLAMSYIAGLLNRLDELTVIGTPTPNGYKRHTDWSFCPVNATWGGDNRTVAVRLIEHGPEATRVEQRDAAADANPYLVAAAQLLAGLDGIERELAPPDRTNGNAYVIGAPTLPATLEAAISAFETSAFARGALGDQLVELLLSAYRGELSLYNAQVSDWERDRYMETS